MDSESQKKYLVERIKFLMDMIETPWFYCFGKLQAFVVSRGSDFDMNYDIDIGIIRDKVDIEKVVYVFSSEGYKLKNMIINDVNGEPLNMHFEPTEYDMKNTPSLDVFCWIRKGKMLYHTYDVNREGKQIPREYVFKGVPAKFLDPNTDTVALMRKTDQSLREDGTWEYDIFGQYSGYSIRLPFAYGSLLDIWYPGWLFPHQKNVVSNAVDIIRTKSCAGLK